MKMTIPFSEVKPCEEFEYQRTLRNFRAFKILPLKMFSESGPSKGQLVIVSAVITRDHSGGKALDAGTAIIMPDYQYVIVDRPPPSGS